MEVEVRQNRDIKCGKVKDGYACGNQATMMATRGDTLVKPLGKLAIIHKLVSKVHTYCTLDSRDISKLRGAASCRLANLQDARTGNMSILALHMRDVRCQRLHAVIEAVVGGGDVRGASQKQETSGTPPAPPCGSKF